MKQIFLLILFGLLSKPLYADDQQSLAHLDSIISLREQYLDRKEKHISALKQRMVTEKAPETRLALYQELYDEYYVYQFDSAKIYVNKGLALARQTGNQRYINLNTIAKAGLLSIGGLYGEAVGCLDSLSTTTLDIDLQFKYHLTSFTLYNYWSAYCNDNEYAPSYRSRAMQHLQQAIGLLHPEDPLYDYYMGEYQVYVAHNPDKALEHYQRAFHNAPEESRTYAMAAFAIANNYSARGNMEQYMAFLVRAAVSDIVGSTKENLALQYLAVRLFEQNEDDIERAERYINVSMEDAKFYNNRLRMLEVSQRLPLIVSTYQTTIKQQNRSLKYAIGFISLLAIGLIVSLLLIARQNKLLTKRRKDLSRSNSLLSELNRKLTELNKKLTESNDKLIDTNQKREGLAKIYIDLCARYIDKLKKYQTLVKRKIKANQVAELLSIISSSRISEDDAATFMNKFDKAFLDLYPSFIAEFNQLLREEEQIQIKQPHTMTPELRIFALIRLGVKDSSEIANLLFYSPQTIYNYRSTTRNKAIDREHFEEDVARIS
ncbi:MAG: hypothetical protein IJV27_05170 [Prevotella sp.]|nr:hypothetical protein [Prevotella sp.]